jgi:hypothetical protein
MRRSLLTLAIGALIAAPALGHGPQIQLTNDNNKIVTRNIMLDDPYNTFPDPPTNPVSVYVIPLAPISAFGGTEVWTQPSGDPEFQVAGPGIAWSYGWTFDTGPHTTFPAGANFVETLVGGLQKHNGTTFVTAPGGAQLEIFKSDTNFGVGGGPTPFVTLKTIVAPTSADDTTHLDDHTSISFQLLGDGVIPDATHVPAPVADGIYLEQLKLSLANQPAGSTIQDSDPFYFVMYQGVDQSAAIAAAQAAFPGASIQAVPEPASAALLIGLGAISMVRHRRQSPNV